MEASQLQILISSVASLFFCVFVYYLGKRGRLSFRYTIGWLSLGFLGVIASFAIIVVKPVANFLSISPAAAIAIGALILLLLLCVQLSISISGLQRQITKLAEKIALQDRQQD